MNVLNYGLTVLSLFDGLSCGMIALERAGVKVNSYYASEVDKHAIQVSHHNYPEIIRVGDVNKVRYSNGVLSTEFGDYSVGKIDLLIGGSPCTGFSLAGKQLAFTDVQSKLYFEYERILKEIQEHNPDVKFLLENVKMKAEYQDAISERLNTQPIVINSNLVSAQNRHRLYWTNILGVQPPEDRGVYLKDVLQGYQEGWKVFTKKYSKKPKTNQIKAGCLTAGACSGGNHSDMDVIVFDESNVPLNNSGRIDIHAEGVRRYSCEEWELLQTVPVGYTSCVSSSQRYKMLGNGWTVDVIAHIFKNLLKKSVDSENDVAYNSFIGRAA